MATKIGEAYVDVDAKLDKYNKNIKKGEKKLKKFSDNTAKASKKMSSSFASIKSALPLIGIAALGAAISKVIKLSIVQEKAEAQLNATLKSTEFAAGLTATQIKNMASELQNMSTFGDEAIISSSSLLLTFKEIGGEVFPRAQQSILDMSIAMKQDLRTSSIMLGKALNDPILGLSAMSRVGIQFSEDNKILIKSLTKTGDIAGAQAIILKELESQFGGSAKAAADTMGGALEQLSNTWGDALEELAGGGDSFKETIQGINKALITMKPIFTGIGIVIDELISAFSFLTTGLIDFYKSIADFIIPIIEDLNKKFDDLIEGAKELVRLIPGLQDFATETFIDKGEDFKDKPKKRKRPTVRPKAKPTGGGGDDKEARLQDARDFLSAMDELNKSAWKKQADGEQKLLDKVASLRAQGLIDAQEAEDAETEIKKKGVLERTQAIAGGFETWTGKTMDFISALDEVFSADEENKVNKIEERRNKELEALDDKLEKDTEDIEKNIKNKKKADKAIQKLEKEKAKAEEAINDKADKDKAALELKAFKRHKAVALVQAGIDTALAVVAAASTQPFIPLGIVAMALAAAAGAASIIAIAAQQPPALADGGVTLGQTLATIGESGSEMVTPLDGARGQKSRQMFVDDILSSLAARQEAGSVGNEANVANEEEINYNITVNIGADEFHANITQAISDRNILVDQSSLIKR